MRAIETKTVITEDRKQALQLPQDVAPGEHRVVVLLDERVLGEEDTAETPLRWEDGLLVYDGKTAGPIESAVDDVRDERMRHILAGYRP